MKLFARVLWRDPEKTLGIVVLLWRCPTHQYAVRWFDGDPPPCPACTGVVKVKTA